jgi:hypothetical protein
MLSELNTFRELLHKRLILLDFGFTVFFSNIKDMRNGSGILAKDIGPLDPSDKSPKFSRGDLREDRF